MKIPETDYHKLRKTYNELKLSGDLFTEYTGMSGDWYSDMYKFIDQQPKKEDLWDADVENQSQSQSQKNKKVIWYDNTTDNSSAD